MLFWELGDAFIFGIWKMFQCVVVSVYLTRSLDLFHSHTQCAEAEKIQNNPGNDSEPAASRSEPVAEVDGDVEPSPKRPRKDAKSASVTDARAEMASRMSAKSLPESDHDKWMNVVTRTLFSRVDFIDTSGLSEGELAKRIKETTAGGASSCQAFLPMHIECLATLFCCNHGH